jgi:hypothetical protein
MGADGDSAVKDQAACLYDCADCFFSCFKCCGPTLVRVGIGERSVFITDKQGERILAEIRAVARIRPDTIDALILESNIPTGRIGGYVCKVLQEHGLFNEHAAISLPQVHVLIPYAIKLSSDGSRGPCIARRYKDIKRLLAKNFGMVVGKYSLDAAERCALAVQKVTFLRVFP